MNPFEVKIVPGVLEKMVDKYVNKVVESMLDGRTWSLDQFRKECCGGKSKEWVNLYILSEFAEEIDYHLPDGWLIPSQGRGSQNIIFASKACKWMEANKLRINWQAKMPK